MTASVDSSIFDRIPEPKLVTHTLVCRPMSKTALRRETKSAHHEDDMTWEGKACKTCKTH